MKLCPNCNNEVTKKRNKFCSQSCSNSYNNIKFHNIDKTPKNCKQCYKEITYDKKFCNQSCAATFNNTGRVRTEESKEKMSKIMSIIAIENNYVDNFRNEDGSIKRNSNNTKKRTSLNCFNTQCNNICSVIDWNLKNYHKHYCSDKCRRDEAGGLRHGSGRGKKGWYKGYFCDSTYELAYVIYNIDNNIVFERSSLKIPYKYKGKNHNYHPDFEIGDTIIEIKGYHTEQVDYKLSATRALGYTIEILYEKDLKYVFDYVKDNYNYKNIEELYEK